MPTKSSESGMLASIDGMRLFRVALVTLVAVALLIALYFLVRSLSLGGFFLVVLVVCIAVVVTWRLASCK